MNRTPARIAAVNHFISCSETYWIEPNTIVSADHVSPSVLAEPTVLLSSWLFLANSISTQGVIVVADRTDVFVRIGTDEARMLGAGLALASDGVDSEVLVATQASDVAFVEEGLPVLLDGAIGEGGEEENPAGGIQDLIVIDVVGWKEILVALQLD